MYSMGLFNMADVKLIKNVCANINPWPLKGETEEKFARIILECFLGWVTP
jgi:hypothetical protein